MSGAGAWMPRWWAGEAGALGRAADVVLAPAEMAYRGVTRLRNALYDGGRLAVASPAIPTISVGNLSVGGAGKTPVAAWVAGRLRGWGRQPAIALRGYGADEVEVHRALNPEVPVFAAARRADAVRAAAAAGCDCAVLDDGFQHRALGRDLDVVLVAVEGWTSEPRLLPRGPWREAPAALARADVALVTRKVADEAQRDAVMAAIGRLGLGTLAVVACRLEPTRLRPLHPGRRTRPLDALRGRPVLAVAALATPGPFFLLLEQVGAVVESAPFADHHDFTEAEAAGLAERARDRTLVMTLKDAVKLGHLIGPEVDAWVLHQTVVMETGAALFDERLRRVLEGGRR